MANILAGKPFADSILATCATEVKQLRAAGIKPGLAMVLVGDDPASTTYVSHKRAACQALGIVSTLVELAATCTTAQVVSAVRRLNADAGVHGILVQQPLPRQVDTGQVVQAVLPTKDVDGLHPHNVGMLVMRGTSQPVACTPQGCMYLLGELGFNLRGKRAVVIGRSMIVGRPLAMLLDQAGATVTVCHSQTKDLAAACRQADVLAVAAGCPGLVTAAMVKPGAIVLDIGINRDAAGRLCGDTLPEVSEVAGKVTKVPGGIGPLTVAMLMRNTVAVAHQASKEISRS